MLLIRFPIQTSNILRDTLISPWFNKRCMFELSCRHFKHFLLYGIHLNTLFICRKPFSSEFQIYSLCLLRDGFFYRFAFIFTRLVLDMFIENTFRCNLFYPVESWYGMLFFKFAASNYASTQCTGCGWLVDFGCVTDLVKKIESVHNSVPF